MHFKIAGYPHAWYNPVEKAGYLSLYYPWEAVRNNQLTQNQWRNETHSPKILNYKEGTDASIDLLVEPFAQFLDSVQSVEGYDTATLVPLPSSTPGKSANFTSVPKSATSQKNRDNRNLIFVSKLHQARPHVYGYSNLLERVKEKPPRETWIAIQHCDSMTVVLPPINNSVLILIDDVVTNSGTMNGSQMCLDQFCNGNKVIQLSIGSSTPSGVFKSIIPLAP